MELHINMSMQSQPVYLCIITSKCPLDIICLQVSTGPGSFSSCCTTGYQEQGEFLLSKFKWGHSFVEQNGHLLDLYTACATAEEVQKVQEEHLKQLQYDHDHRQDKGMQE